jgi:hypothetical protein
MPRNDDEEEHKDSQSEGKEPEVPEGKEAEGEGKDEEREDARKEEDARILRAVCQTCSISLRV